MKDCPECSEGEMKQVDARMFRCISCDTAVSHEGNGYIIVE